MQGCSKNKRPQVKAMMGSISFLLTSILQSCLVSLILKPNKFQRQVSKTPLTIVIPLSLRIITTQKDPHLKNVAAPKNQTLLTSMKNNSQVILNISRIFQKLGSSINLLQLLRKLPIKSVSKSKTLRKRTPFSQQLTKLTSQA